VNGEIRRASALQDDLRRSRLILFQMMSFLQRVAAKSGAARYNMQRLFSEGSGGKVPRLSSESPIASRIFENVKQPVEVEAAAAAAGPSAADAAAMDLLENSTLGRVVSVFGNTLFFGGLAATSYFGYYTYKYDEEQMQRLINDRAKPENSFPGSSVSRAYMVPFLQSMSVAHCSFVLGLAIPP